DGAQLLLGDLGVIRDARRQARRRGLVPRLQPRRTRPLAEFRLGPRDLRERADHAELTRRLAPGTIVPPIVGVAAVGDGVEAALARDRRQVRIETVLAVLTAVGRVGAVLGALNLRGEDQLVAEAERTGGADREVAV